MDTVGGANGVVKPLRYIPRAHRIHPLIGDNGWSAAHRNVATSVARLCSIDGISIDGLARPWLHEGDGEGALQKPGGSAVLQRVESILRYAERLLKQPAKECFSRLTPATAF